ncbi:hypothetical protein DRJ16_01480 [Candidatus Woesearchaeota archaeon]|nr:MAG: hypothetical protein DRJ16_01480 [Candidatus Woesearchaeota archaeon]
MIITITGTPGTGKTTLAKQLASFLRKRKIKCKILDLNAFIKKRKIYDYYDQKRHCYVVDETKLRKAVLPILKEAKKKRQCLIIHSHLSHLLHKRYIDLCIVTKCDLKTLLKRLRKRRYSAEKIRENLDAEIFDICRIEAQERGLPILTINTTKSMAKQPKPFYIMLKKLNTC